MALNGTGYALLAFLSWGFAPLYWKQLAAVSLRTVFAYRAISAFLSFLLILLIVKRMRAAIQAVFSAKILAIYLLAAVLVGTNSSLYVWGVLSGRTLQVSLGYFLTPLINVLLGVLVLRERLRPLEIFATLLAGGGVIYLATQMTEIQWIAIGLALFFSLYSLVRKLAPLDSLTAMALENGFLSIPAVVYLLWPRAGVEQAASSPQTFLLLAGGGLIYALPFWWFTIAAKKVPLSKLGLMQYIAPSCQFLVAVLINGEPFTSTHLVTFGLIWAALAVYVTDTLLRNKKPLIQ